MRFADGRRRRRPATLAVLVTLSLVILATLAGASQGRLAAAAKRVPVGGLTAVKFRTIRVAGKRVDPHGNPNSTKEFKSLYAGDRIQATVEGTVWFDVRVGDKAIYCTTRPDGPDPGDLQVSPDPKK